ncbi:hypothetical protein GCM10025768_06660 [Microbacterium pseudoresistens]|uniref:Copper chaperone PCu(A)C n=1 Tax=Microbacterium pseudoresistens TaxID=640634 RepID=A0A7Y9JNF3_9MICO|nr:copper chaperone PCu(A)C [Microbacterium pseudoresistens]NYD54503.1 hypothetical protein [Microbacterium pseudoresistens]
MTTSSPFRSFSLRSAAGAGALALAAGLALSGCAPAASAGTSPSASASASTAASSVTVVDGWIKAADSGMSAAFGELRNDGAADATLTAVRTTASSMIQLHETVDDGAGQMQMQEKDGGFAIPAGGRHVLEPGGDHIMFMELAAPLRAGDEVELTLEFSDGSTTSVTLPVKDYAGANEKYSDGDEHAGHGSAR